MHVGGDGLNKQKKMPEMQIDKCESNHGIGGGERLCDIIIVKNYIYH